MSWTKLQFVQQAFRKAGLASYIFDLTPDQLNSAMYDMDAMLATWNAKGIRLGYPIPTSPENASLNTETNVPDSANEAIYLNLAIRIAPDFGKMIPPEVKVSAKLAYDALLSRAAMPAEMQLPSMPSGAGNKPWRTEAPYLATPVDPLLVGQDSAIDFE